MSILKLANRTGIPCLEVLSIDVTATNVVFNFADHPLFRNNFQGLFLIRNDKTFATSSLPIQFATAGVSGSTVDAYNVGNVALTGSDFNKTGIYLFFYDRPTNKLQIVSRII